MLGQKGRFRRPFQVAALGRAIGFVEQPGGFGDRCDLAMIRGRDQRGPAALCTGGADEIQHGLVQRQFRGIEHRLIGDLGLESRASFGDPPRQARQKQRIAGNQRQKRLVKRIRAAKRFIEVDDDHNIAIFLRGGLGGI